jgi:hypothetical protein
MTATPSTALLLLSKQVEEVKQLFSETNVESNNWLLQQQLTINQIRHKFNKPVEEQVNHNLAQLNDPNAASISAEEKHSIIQKLRDTASLPKGQLSGDDSLYLEQQLSDLLALNVVTKLENRLLPYNFGTIAPLSHIKRFPGDTLEMHGQVLEAGSLENRSNFGWIDKESNAEEYSVSIQVQYSTEWQSQRQELRKWFSSKKVIVINPFNLKAVIANIIDVGPSMSSRKQFGGSPELIRELEAWSLTAQGRVLVFFIDNQGLNIPSGPVSLFDSNLSV